MPPANSAAEGGSINQAIDQPADQADWLGFHFTDWIFILLTGTNLNAIWQETNKQTDMRSSETLATRGKGRRIYLELTEISARHLMQLAGSHFEFKPRAMTLSAKLAGLETPLKIRIADSPKEVARFAGQSVRRFYPEGRVCVCGWRRGVGIVGITPVYGGLPTHPFPGASQKALGTRFPDPRHQHRMCTRFIIIITCRCPRCPNNILAPSSNEDAQTGPSIRRASDSVAIPGGPRFESLELSQEWDLQRGFTIVYTVEFEQDVHPRAPPCENNGREKKTQKE